MIEENRLQTPKRCFDLKKSRVTVKSVFTVIQIAL